MAIQSPLLESSINGAHGVILSVIGSEDIELDEIEQAASMIQAAAHPDAHIIFGASISEDAGNQAAAGSLRYVLQCKENRADLRSTGTAVLRSGAAVCSTGTELLGFSGRSDAAAAGTAVSGTGQRSRRPVSG